MAQKLRPCVGLCPLHHLRSSLANTTLGMPTIALERFATLLGRFRRHGRHLSWRCLDPIVS